MSYPSVTICRRPGFKTKHFPKYGLRKNEGLLYHNVFRFFNFTRYSIKDFLNETTYTFEEVVGLLAYNGCGGELAAVTWKSFDTITQGKCFTFQPGETSDKFSISGGWWFYMLHDMTQRSEDHFGVSEYGTSVYVHHDSDILTSEGEQENNFLEHIYVEAAEDIRMQLKYQSFRRVRSKDNLCIDPEENPEYSRSKCLELCFQYYVANQTNCTLPWLWLLPDDWLPQCSNFTQVHRLVTAFLPHNRKAVAANCSEECPKSCHVTLYTPNIISRKQVAEEQFPHSFIAMYYSNNIVTEMMEMEGYNANAFISDIGGSLGFLLGLSVISFLAVLEAIICGIIKKIFKKKNEKLEEGQNSETQSNISSNISSSTKLESLGKRNQSIDSRLENLRDFDTDEMRCFERTLVAQGTSRY
ncbi:uncharacterized protein LOC126737577 isoform X2 [Anthonomus grandis grandis]|nr:uncharacterized protein LOC126737577 isoform X2 [Anthonomus grandis grandis]XP_050298510.1 uncharacterized protein LOC126737577 isoform X2 [Anthonomus grandis grandis]